MIEAKISKAEYMTSVVNIKNLPTDDIPHICVIGRSNAGKSSFINKLCNNSKLARVAKVAGRTRMLNFFSINDRKFYLVDFPGYGYQQGTKTQVIIWGSLLEDYLKSCSNIRQVLILMDIRHTPSDNDIQMVDFLYRMQIPFLVLASKSDKLSKFAAGKQINIMAASLKIGKDNIIPFSSLNGNNIKTITNLIFEKLINNIDKDIDEDTDSNEADIDINIV